MAKSYNKSKSNNKKGVKSKSTDCAEVKEYVSQPNDWRWYVPNQQLLKDVGSLPFTNALGARDYRGTYGDKYNDYSVPGVMRIDYIPTLGYSADINDAVNICARNIYSFIKSFNSRAKTYDAPDLMLYIISMNSALTYHAWMKRLYGLMNTTSYTNRYYPAAAVRAAGGDYDDLLGNITQLRAYINNFAIRLKALPIPDGFNIFKRHEWLTSGVYLDSRDTLKPQSYVFTPSIYYQFGLDQDLAGTCKAVKVTQREMTFSEIKSFGENLLAPILSGAGEEDFNLIGADILYSYGVDKVRRAEVIDESYNVLPIYDEWVNDQINNIRCYGEPELNTLNITQDSTKNYLVQMPVISVSSTKPWNEMVMDQRVNLFSTDTSPEHIIEATRFMYIPEVREDGGRRDIMPVSCGTELVSGMQVYYYATLTGKAKDWKLFRSPIWTSIITAAFETAENFEINPLTGKIELGQNVSVTAQQIIDGTIGLFDALGEFSSFDRHPLLYLNTVISPMNDPTKISSHYGHIEITDLNNYASISTSQLRAMNDMALLGLYGLETYGK